MADEQLTAWVTVPASKSDPNEMTFEEIPLPPMEFWPLERDSKVNKTADMSNGEQALNSVSSRPRKSLRFIGGEISKSVTLRFPFEDDEFGEVRAINIRRLTVGEVGEVLDERSGDEPDNFDIYARMTGLPADVLRGLMDVDGEEVSRICFDFLPRYFRGNQSEALSPPENGET